MQTLNSLRYLRANIPEHWNKLLELDKVSPTTFKMNKKTLHDLDKRFAEEIIEEE